MIWSVPNVTIAENPIYIGRRYWSPRKSLRRWSLPWRPWFGISIRHDLSIILLFFTTTAKSCITLGLCHSRRVNSSCLSTENFFSHLAFWREFHFGIQYQFMSAWWKDWMADAPQVGLPSAISVELHINNSWWFTSVSEERGSVADDILYTKRCARSFTVQRRA